MSAAVEQYIVQGGMVMCGLICLLVVGAALRDLHAFLRRRRG